MISLQGVTARRGPLSRVGLSLDLGPGLHALVGAPADGGPQLLSLMAGREEVRTGVVQVLGTRPQDPACRPQVGYVPRVPALPGTLRVGEILALAAEVRGEDADPVEERLGALGIGALANRRASSLSADEARAVAMTEALTSTRVRVVLVEEPRVGIDPRVVGKLAEGLRARAAAGDTVVLATASVRDAGALADDHLVLGQGVVLGRTASLDELASFTTRGASMSVVASDAAGATGIAAALATEPDVESVTRRDSSVVARGRDAVSVAAAVGRAVLASGADVLEMRLAPPSLDDARQAVAGLARGTFEAARAHAAARGAASGGEP
jgi:ABC-2 type transport system ATP-binding protein